MNKSLLRALTVVGLCMSLDLLPALGAYGDDALVTSVFANVNNGYARKKLPDGSFQRETYAISNGGFAPGTGRDESIDHVPFPKIAGLVAEHLAKRNYFLAHDSKSADLLLVVYWGATNTVNTGPGYQNQLAHTLGSMNSAVATTPPPGSAGEGRSIDGIQPISATLHDAAAEQRMGDIMQLQMFEQMRMQANERNANLLGYIQEINSRNDISRFAGAGTAYQDLITDLEEERYYVIIAAYDFRAATHDRKKKLLWTTRVSIRAQGNRFDASLAAMLGNASRYFGQDSGRLLREYQRVPRVDLGELKSLGTVPAPAGLKN